MKYEKSKVDKDIFNKRRDERDKIRKTAFEYLETKSKMHSYDVIHQYLEKWYLSDEKIDKYIEEEGLKNQSIDLFDIFFYNLKHLSQSLISKLDDKIIYKYWENQNDKEFLGGFSGKNKIHLYRSLNQLIPTDILVVLFALNSENKHLELEKFWGNIATTDLTLESILKNGVAENHLHLGVTLSFSLTWESLVKEMTKGESNSNKKFFLREFAHTHKDTEMYFYLCLARILRKFLIYIVCTEKIRNKFSKDNGKKEDVAEILELNKKLEEYFYHFDYKKLKQNIIYNSEEKDRLWAIESYFLNIQEEFDKNLDFKQVNEIFYKKELRDIDTFEENKFLFSMLENIFCDIKCNKKNRFIKKNIFRLFKIKKLFI